MDEKNCGDCDVVCGEEKSCTNGQCMCKAAGLTNCDGECVDLLTNSMHCGACGINCNADVNPYCPDQLSQSCYGGTCAYDNCDGSLCNCGGQCADLSTNNEHCGACDNACTGGKYCTGGKCVCPPSLTDCGGVCVDLLADASHCGQCDLACDDNPYCPGFCTGGYCSQGCAPPLCECNGMCVDHASDPNHCGGCEAACDVGNGFACIGGQCECVGALTDCDGECVDLQSDADNCGACGKHCNGGQCVAGKCP
jgi:hypothetical protein